MKNAFNYETEIGLIGIMEENGYITDIVFGSEVPEGAVTGETMMIRKAFDQIEEYLSGKRKVFGLPLLVEGTKFQEKVWNELLKIPYGETRTYGQVAEAVGKPKAVRAVGAANNRNALPIIIPCHRVVGSKGGLTGYSGGLEAKRKLLEIEEKNR
ncbi:methylated-DNA--[protein]-cysteine S-methyltransferase [Youngiibacter fragilis]|uniref:Methylated-DNA--protein-cysteine methyltransferase n=1 Tax=Youngiibacter fragilis 232.1 TaxID=994573 RepID=V7I5N6_9CLOT|nr:methylated-DNA--[protein]-cysteine S-methyltransferase [Youngiibacter fragilis]ETA80509.1 methylated-DNA--protein-cysteine methyltransferase [Youngiibacter fragilis 232.1]